MGTPEWNRPDVTVEVERGQDVVLEAPEEAKWERDGTEVSAATRKFTISMDGAGSRAGKYRYVVNGQKSAPITVQLRQSVVTRLLGHWMAAVSVSILFGCFVYVVIRGLWLATSTTDHALTVRASAFAVGVLAYGLFLLWLVGKAWPGSHGLLYLVKGEDRRTSTSKVQYVIWTFGIAFVLAYIAARVGITPKDGALDSASFICGEKVKKNCIPESVWDDYLLLIGLPATTAAVVKGVTVSKVTEGTLQKTPAETATVSDVATNDQGQPDLVDVQYLLFNLIAFLYVAVNFVQRGVLAPVPGVLLGLTSAAAGTYVLNKALQNNKPVIVSLSPSVATVGATLLIRGRNLFPPGAQDTVSVDIGGVKTQCHLA